MSFRKFFIKLHKFKVDYELPAGIKRCVLIMAPHTSFYDFIIGKTIMDEIGLKATIIIKKEFFVWPIKGFLKRCNCIPIDRKHARNFFSFVIDQFKQNEEMTFLICPEGTRDLVKEWKKGFYRIAMEANVPICFGYMDYNSHHVGVAETFYPTGDYDKDIEYIYHFFGGMRGQHKGKFNLENRPFDHPEWAD